MYNFCLKFKSFYYLNLRDLEDLSIGLLTSFDYKENDMSVEKFLLQKNRFFGDMHLLEIADKSKCSKFLASKPVQNLISKIWKYGINLHCDFVIVASSKFGFFGSIIKVLFLIEDNILKLFQSKMIIFSLYRIF